MTTQVVALCGGVGGAKLALGLLRTLPEKSLTVVVNTGDDFEHLGLPISPDLDTVLYTLGGLADRERGWGRENESWNFIDALDALGGDSWFRLGDRDMAMHVMRRQWLSTGGTLSGFAADMARRLGIGAAILPMSDDAVRTMVATTEGELAFQHYFVRQRCEPVVTGIRFAGAAEARPSPGVRESLNDPALQAIVICPSNPYLSVDPVLAVPGIREALAARRAPCVAVSPIIGGQAVKGPTAKIMAELSLPVTNAAIAAHYTGLIDGLIIDEADAGDAAGLSLPVLAVPTLMRMLDDRDRLARAVAAFAATLTTGA